MSIHTASIFSFLKWAWDFLLHYSFFQSRSIDYPRTSQELSLCGSKYDPSSGNLLGETECSVCLCKIEEGAEIRHLRCDHVFHRDCLDRWVGHGRTTCPLCRDSLAPPRIFDETGMEVWVFKYHSSFASCRDRETWWLR